jgi:DNA-directed RNA polymerase III subunit RPC6
MVYHHIKSCGNIGVWMKDLVRNTGLHRTVITKAIKALESHAIIKSVKSVKYPTRKIYMLSELSPAVELTGGAWFSDHELDVEFIRALGLMCEKFIKDQVNDDKVGYAGMPSASDVLNFIVRSNVTEQPLALSDVEQLLEMLVFDRVITRVTTVRRGESIHVYAPSRISAYYERQTLNERALNVDYLAKIPCGICPVMGDCSLVYEPKRMTGRGVISPQTCQYFDSIINDLQ